MLYAFLFLLTVSCAHSNEENGTCPTDAQLSSIATSQVVADMKETLEKSRKFMKTMDSTVHDFVFELESRLKVDYRQLEDNVLPELNGRTSSDCRKTCKAEVATAVEQCESRKMEGGNGTVPTPVPPATPEDRQKWTGPSNSCALLIHENGTELFLNITDYPKNVGDETVLFKLRKPLGVDFGDKTKGVIVRQGCMATLWTHPHKYFTRSEIRDLANIEGGEYEVKTLSSGTAEGGYEVNGLSRVNCMCDPLKTEEDAKQEKKDCTKHHIWNEKTKKCEWILDSNICGEIETKEGFKMRLRIPSFLCERTQWMFCHYGNSTLDVKKTLTTSGYGIHEVMANTVRVVCECMNDNTSSLKSQLKSRQIASLITTSTRKQRDANIEFAEDDAKWNDKIVSASIRRGCMATFWWLKKSDHDEAEYKILANVEYGEYELESMAAGTSARGVAESGVTRVSCYCDSTRTSLSLPLQPTKEECLPDHEFDETTGVCEWKSAKNICGEIENDQGEKMTLEIPNWPLNKRYDVNFENANLSSFDRKITSFSVRQHCFISLYAEANLKSELMLRAYGNYTEPSVGEKTKRIVCECMQ